MMSIPNEPPYLSDEPISAVDQDQLGWGKRLVPRIVDMIEGAGGQGSFVIGLQGKWGSGKSTLLNLVEARLLHRGQCKLIRYNPWLYPDVDHTQNFFGELSKHFEWEEADAGRKRMINLMQLMANVASVSAETTRLLQILFVTFGAILFILGVTQIATSQLLTVIPLVLGIVCIALGAIKRLSEAIHKLLLGQAPRDLSLDQLKAKLAGEIIEQKIKIVVLMDDLDRLLPGQLCDCFQLVKNNGDLPNITYVMAYDRAVVENMLVDSVTREFKGFPEKIVQVEFSVPPPERDLLDRYFLEQLRATLDNLPSSIRSTWNRDRWTNIYLLNLRWFLRNFRDVKRVINGLRLEIPYVVGNGHPEVDLVDFVTIEILRIRFPELYAFIRDHKRTFVGRAMLPSEILGVDEEEEKRDKEELKSFLSNAFAVQDRCLIQNALNLLFEYLYRGDKIFADASNRDQARDLRIGAWQIFDRFFIYGNYEGDISNNFVSELRDGVLRHKSYLEMLKPYVYTNKLRDIVDRVVDKVNPEEQNPAEITDHLAFVFDLADYLAEDSGAVYTPSLWASSVWAETLLRPFDKEHRFNLLVSGFRQSEGIFGPVMAVSIWLSESKDARSRADGPFIESQPLCVLQERLRPRLVAWMSSPDAVIHPHFRAILHIAKDWLERRQFEDLLFGLLASEDNFKRFLTRFLIRTEALEPGAVAGKRVEYRFDFQGLDHIVEVERVFSSRSSFTRKMDEPETQLIALDNFMNGYHTYVQSRSKSGGTVDSTEHGDMK